MKYLITLLLLFGVLATQAQLPTRLKLKQLESGLPGQYLKTDSLGNVVFGTGDGNGIYSSSDTIPVATLATVTESAGATMDFAIGKFPNWPNFSLNGTEAGFYYGQNYWGSVGIVNAKSTMEVYPNKVVSYGAQGTDYVGFELRPDFGAIFLSTLNNSALLKIGLGAPEGIVSASQGSIYLRTDGGPTTTLYIKTSGSGNTGWTAK